MVSCEKARCIYQHGTYYNASKTCAYEGDITTRKGCEWEGVVSEVSNHLRKCQFRPIDCAFKHIGCNDESYEKHANDNKEVDFMIHYTEYNKCHHNLILKQIAEINNMMPVLRLELTELQIYMYATVIDILEQLSEVKKEVTTVEELKMKELHDEKKINKVALVKSSLIQNKSHRMEVVNNTKLKQKVESINAQLQYAYSQLQTMEQKIAPKQISNTFVFGNTKQRVILTNNIHENIYEYTMDTLISKISKLFPSKGIKKGKIELKTEYGQIIEKDRHIIEYLAQYKGNIEVHKKKK
eukprot:156869_1